MGETVSGTTPMSVAENGEMCMRYNFPRYQHWTQWLSSKHIRDPRPKPRGVGSLETHYNRFNQFNPFDPFCCHISKLRHGFDSCYLALLGNL